MTVPAETCLNRGDGPYCYDHDQDPHAGCLNDTHHYNGQPWHFCLCCGDAMFDTDLRDRQCSNCRDEGCPLPVPPHPTVRSVWLS